MRTPEAFTMGSTFIQELAGLNSFRLWNAVFLKVHQETETTTVYSKK